MSAGREPSGLARLAELIDAWSAKQGLTQGQAARRIGVNVETLRLIRVGKYDGVRPATRDKIEDALGWTRGSVKAILDGGAPTPVEVAGPVGPPEPSAVASEPRSASRGGASPEDIIIGLQLALERGRELRPDDPERLFWRALQVANDLHNPLREKPVEPAEHDRSA